jgi:hypothetical protein
MIQKRLLATNRAAVGINQIDQPQVLHRMRALTLALSRRARGLVGELYAGGVLGVNLPIVGPPQLGPPPRSLL